MRESGSGRDWQAGMGLLLLRLSLAWFLFVWAVNKLLVPEQYQKIWSYFHGIDIDATAPYVMGSLQIAVCLCIALGFGRIVSYGLGFVMHAVTVVVILPALLDPFLIEDGFPTNRNQSIALAALGGFAALWLLRAHDHWSLDAWLRRRR